jgi:hypothetical protein
MTAEDEVTQAHRWNIELADDGIRVCFGLHERAQGCEWVSFVPKERAERAEADVSLLRSVLQAMLAHASDISAICRDNLTATAPRKDGEG